MVGPLALGLGYTGYSAHTYLQKQLFLWQLNTKQDFDKLVSELRTAAQIQKYIQLNKENIARVLRSTYGKEFVSVLIDKKPDAVNEFIRPILITVLINDKRLRNIAPEKLPLLAYE